MDWIPLHKGYFIAILHNNFGTLRGEDRLRNQFALEHFAWRKYVSTHNNFQLHFTDSNEKNDRRAGAGEAATENPSRCLAWLCFTRPSRLNGHATLKFRASVCQCFNCTIRLYEIKY